MNNRTRVSDITRVAATVCMEVCRTLIGLHSYTGCDTVSAFAEQKAKPLKLLIQSTDYQDMFLKNGKLEALYVPYVCP